MAEEKPKVISLTLKRKGLDIVLDIKTAPEIEDFFKKASISGRDDDFGRDCSQSFGKSETSQKWLGADGEGLKYYVKNVKLSDRVSGYHIMDNFGNGLMEDNKFNLAFLRCVGISEGISIKTNDLLSLEEMKQFMQKLSEWTKKFYEIALSESEIIADITIEKESETLASVE